MDLLSFRKLLHGSEVALIHLRPHGLDPRPTFETCFPVLLALLEPLAGQAPIDFALDVVAAADRFVQEATGVALVKGGHDFFAVWGRGVSMR